jgi:dinuclear metal center YbgI/SA1388 family protein
MLMTIDILLAEFQKLFPFSYSESYDNVGLIIGNQNDTIAGAMLCLNVTEQVVNEAIEKSCNLIISHHPLIFHGLKHIVNDSSKERLIRLCIKKDINIIALHTNIDKMYAGLNNYVATQLGLQYIKTLAPEKGLLRKLVTFCPSEHAENVRTALFSAGAGVIGNYDSCSYNISGYGTFKGNEQTNPFVGQKNAIHHEAEVRIETVFPQHIQTSVIKALLSSHPYEEVAYDIYLIENAYDQVGLGVIGQLTENMTIETFLNHVKTVLKTPCLRYSECKRGEVSKVAFCGGSGSHLIQHAISQGADAFITADISYHQFDIGYDNLLLVDAGHFETEIFFKDYFANELSEINVNFAIYKSQAELNHIKYY